MAIVDTLRRLSTAVPPDPRADGELLTRFVRTRDESAFTELLRRHGPTVYGVCRRLLGPGADSDDAFQAVFLVLVRKASAVRPPGMVGNWLHGVAVRTAQRARAMAVRRRLQERAAVRPRADSTDVPDGETLAVLDAELAALPGVYRAVLMACDLNGRSRSETAKELGWAEGTVATRLMKGRQLLADRLRRRGVTLAVGAVVVPSALAAQTVVLARELMTTGTASVAPAVLQLTNQMVSAMSRTKLNVVAVGLVLAVMTAGGLGVWKGAETTAAPVPKEVKMEWKEAEPITFNDGGRVTSVAFASSGKTFAVCREGGQIDFYDPSTRKHQQSMVLKHDPKVNANTQVGTATTIAFRPTPHEKLGDVFAVTHKHGVNFGTTTIGLLVDNAAAVEGVSDNWELKDVDPRQVVWLADDSLVVTNGQEVVWRVQDDGRWGRYHWSQAGEVGGLMPLAVLPGQSKVFVTRGETEKEANELHFAARPLPSPRAKLIGHKSRPVAAAVTKDGKRIVSADEGGTLIVWEGEKFEEKRRVENGPGFAAFALATDGKTVAYVRSHGVSWTGGAANRSSTVFELVVFDVTDPPAKLTPIWTSDTRAMPGKRSGPVSLAFSPEGTTLLAAFADPFTDDKVYGDIPKSVGVKVWTLGVARQDKAAVPKDEPKAKPPAS